MSLFPRLSPNGLNLVTQEPGKFGHGWLDDIRTAWYRGNGPGISTSDGKAYPWAEPDSLTVGGGGFAANYWNAELKGIRHNSGLVVDGGFHGTLSDTGRLAYLTGHETGQLQVLRDTQGSEYDSVARLEYPRACGAGVAWSKYEDGTQRTWYADWGGTKRRVHASGARAEFRPVPVVTPNGVWIVCYTHVDVRGYKEGTTRGFIRPCLNGRAVDGKWNGSGLRVVWNGANGQLFDEVIDLAGPMVALDETAQEPVTVPTIGRRLWLGWFLFPPFDWALPGNCDLCVEPEMIVRDESGRSIAAYVAGNPDGDVDSLERNAAAAKLKFGLPVIAYWTRKAQEGRVPRGAEIIGVEAYRLKDESLLAFETRVLASVRRCGKVALICQCYTSNALQTTDLASLVPIYAKIARDCSNVVALLAFSGSGRPTGLQDNPSVRPLWESLAAGIPGPPEVEDDMLKPGVTITEWHEIRPNVLVARAHDRNNPDHYTIEFRIENGYLRVRMTNAEGTDISNATARKVL